MTKDDLLLLALELPIDDQIDLAQTLWEHASPPASFSLSPEVKEQRLAALRELATFSLPVGSPEEMERESVPEVIEPPKDPC